MNSYHSSWPWFWIRKNSFKPVHTPTWLQFERKHWTYWSLRNPTKEQNMKILPKYNLMLTLRGSWPIRRPPTLLIIRWCQGLGRSLVGRAKFRFDFIGSCRNLGYLRQGGRLWKVRILASACKAISTRCLEWPGIGFLNQQAHGTFLDLAWAAVPLGPGLCGLKLSEKTFAGPWASVAGSLSSPVVKS